MKRAIVILCLSTSLFSLKAQEDLLDSIAQKGVRSLIDTVKKVTLEHEQTLQFGSRGFIDFSSGGSWNTSAELVKVWIGEPGAFKIPFFLFAGATNTRFSDDALNLNGLYDLINPIGGNLSLAFNYFSRPIYESSSQVTSLRFNAFGAGKLIRGIDLESKERIHEIGYFFELGLFFRTGAWEELSPSKSDSYRQGGMAFFSVKYALSLLPEETMTSLFNYPDAPQGLRLEAGLLIKTRINIRVSYFKTTVGEEIYHLSEPQWRLGVDYRVGR